MTDNEFEEIMHNLSKAGFARSLADLESRCSEALVTIAAANGCDPVRLIRTFAISLLTLADNLEDQLNS